MNKIMQLKVNRHLQLQRKEVFRIEKGMDKRESIVTEFGGVRRAMARGQELGPDEAERHSMKAAG